MVIYGKRIILHELRKIDAYALYKYRSKKEVEKYQSFKNYTYEEAKQAVLLTGPQRLSGNYQLGIYLNQQLIGDLYFHITHENYCYMGYTIDSQYWRKGYGYEACQLVMGYLVVFLGIHHFYAYIEDSNQASIALITKLGFKKVDKQLYYSYV